MTSLELSSTTPHFSPLEPIFAPHADQVPFAFREQFLHSADYPYGITLTGKMHSIWHKPRALHPLFWLLGNMGILVPYVGHDIPTTLVVEPGRDSAGQPYHSWKRTLGFEKPIYFNTTIVYDLRFKHVADLVGPKNILYMVWKAQFHPPATFTLDTAACALRFGRRKLWLPRPAWRWMLGVVRFIQRVDDAQDDTMHIDLLISHPLFGEIFGYTGTFRVIRTPVSQLASRVT
jgi:hypothetical protein